MPNFINSEIFAPFEQFLLGKEYSDYDLFEIIGQATLEDQTIGSAMAFHAKDVLWENHDADISYAKVIAEVYRRTYFDPAHAGKYGTIDATKDAESLLLFTHVLMSGNTNHADFAPSSSAAH